jgi:hypothetical protein
MPSGSPVCKDSGTCIAPLWSMQVTLDRDQTQVLREILESSLKELRVESARTDSHDFREQLHRREKIVESLLAQAKI